MLNPNATLYLTPNLDFTMKHLIPFLMTVALIATVGTARTAAQTQGGRAGGIVKLLQQVGATPEQIKQVNDARSELQNATNFRTALQTKLTDILNEEQYKKFEEAWRNRGKSPAKSASVPAPVAADTWKTVGLQQANSMGAGAAPIPKGGKFRVFVLMGQSNMNGSGRATELKPPYTEKHERIRIWANGRWEYMVPRNKFGPGVSFAHQLADLWPDDTIGIIKVSCGATGIAAFEKNWSFERAQRSKDGKKGSMYKDLMNAVAEAKRISNPEFCGFVWKQGAADGKKGLAEEYYDNFNQLILDLSTDLGVSNLPTFVPSYAKDKELLQAMLPYLNREETLQAKKSAGEGPVDDEKFLHTVLSYIDDNDLLKTAKPAVKKQRYLATVISAQNRAGRELSNVTTFYPGKLPRDGVHYNSEGYLMLGKITASAVEQFYQSKP